MLTIKELERLLFVLFEKYEEHPNEYDLDLIRKLREIIRGGDVPFAETFKQQEHTYYIWNDYIADSEERISEIIFEVLGQELDFPTEAQVGQAWEDDGLEVKMTVEEYLAHDFKTEVE